MIRMIPELWTAHSTDYHICVCAVRIGVILGCHTLTTVSLLPE